MDGIKVPIKELNFSFSRSSGAGGQNINKVNSKATLRWNLAASKVCSKAMAERFISKFSRYVLEDDIVMISSQRFRNQARNIADCIEKLEVMLTSVKKAPKKRRATKPTRASVEKRLKVKKGKSQLKKNRRKSTDYE
ncbi:MAG: aminoacyl-tRNA hydrolase [Bacteriovoracaceae bacterium]|jgi:ribosome-associated protein|nr:aminoacyl-tRNA hydrolase [Bacteriovoracaceae bacterium]